MSANHKHPETYNSVASRRVATNTHKKHIAAQIASEQQNANLHTAQRFIPTDANTASSDAQA